VLRFLDQAGLMQREKRNNPTRAIPRKQRKAQAEEAAKAAAASKASPAAGGAPAS
jgi:small subunit ribosomal protein S16